MKTSTFHAAYKCKQCRQVCHAHCYPRMPHNCGVAGDSQAVVGNDIVMDRDILGVKYCFFFLLSSISLALSLSHTHTHTLSFWQPEEDTDKAGHRHRSSTLIRSKSKKMQDLHECEGYLYKKGGIVKNWKLRYFVLDTEKRHVSAIV